MMDVVSSNKNDTTTPRGWMWMSRSFRFHWKNTSGRSVRVWGWPSQDTLAIRNSICPYRRQLKKTGMHVWCIYP